ncbi:MAG: DUF3267 domain-containing protein [Clostridia bacterium]|nr:DUF3267 domain-containing protein [Clostridia bacterium]
MENKKERKLSKAELARKEAFEKLTDKLAAQGYTYNLLGISGSDVNSKSLLVMLPIAALFVLLYWLLGHTLYYDSVELLIAVAAFFVLIAVNEGLHGIAWAFFAKGKFKTLSFGITRGSFNPYCTCSEALKKHQLLIGFLMPFIVLGVGFGIAAMLTGSMLLLMMTVLNLTGCGGDWLIAEKLIKYKTDSTDVLFINHPYEFGTAVFEK